MIESHVPNVDAGHATSSHSYRNLVDEVPLFVSKNPKASLIKSADLARDFLVFESLKNGGTEQAGELLKEAAQLGAGFFQCVQSDGQPIKVRYRDGELETVGAYTDHRTSVLEWFEVYWLAVIARDEHALSILASVDESLFNKARTGPAKPYRAAFSRFLKAYANGSDNLGPLIEETRESSDPDGYNYHMLLFDTNVITPLLDLFAIIVNDAGQAAFNETMHSALLKHQEYGKVKDSGCDTYVSFHLSALAVIAYDRLGYEVTVENEYILDWAVK